MRGTPVLPNQKGFLINISMYIPFNSDKKLESNGVTESFGVKTVEFGSNLNPLKNKDIYFKK